MARLPIPQRVDTILLLERDTVVRMISTDIGTARLRSNNHHEGIRLIITKAGKEHITLLTDEEALLLARNLLTQVSVKTFGAA